MIPKILLAATAILHCDQQLLRLMKPRVADLATYSPCDEKNRDERLEKIAIK